MEKIIAYYDNKLKKYGDNFRGVDWNSLESQNLRFKKLLKVIQKEEKYFTLLDYGCGYGAMLNYICDFYNNFDYTGFDISKAMIQEARNKSLISGVSWYNKIDRKKKFDYVIASGLFNVKLDFKKNEWFNYIIETLDQINYYSKKGFSFNILSEYSDKDRRKNKLYYANPNILFNHCKLKYSKYVSLIHDYPLYEFTIIVKK